MPSLVKHPLIQAVLASLIATYIWEQWKKQQ